MPPEFLGNWILAAVTVISLVATVVTVVSKITKQFGDITAKFTSSVNDLKLVIQKLDSSVENVKEGFKRQEDTIREHGKHIDELDTRVTKIETRMEDKN